MDLLKPIIEEIKKKEDTENLLIQKKVINQQKLLKEHKAKQIRFVANEMRRKFSETIKKEVPAPEMKAEESVK